MCSDNCIKLFSVIWNKECYKELFEYISFVDWKDNHEEIFWNKIADNAENIFLLCVEFYSSYYIFELHVKITLSEKHKYRIFDSFMYFIQECVKRNELIIKKGLSHNFLALLIRVFSIFPYRNKNHFLCIIDKFFENIDLKQHELVLCYESFYGSSYGDMNVQYEICKKLTFLNCKHIDFYILLELIIGKFKVLYDIKKMLLDNKVIPTKIMFDNILYSISTGYNKAKCITLLVDYGYNINHGDLYTIIEHRIPIDYNIINAKMFNREIIDLCIATEFYNSVFTCYNRSKKQYLFPGTNKFVKLEYTLNGLIEHCKRTPKFSIISKFFKFVTPNEICINIIFRKCKKRDLYKILEYFISTKMEVKFSDECINIINKYPYMKSLYDEYKKINMVTFQ